MYELSRDDFAAAALNGLLCAGEMSGGYEPASVAKNAAKLAYMIADAMLAERAKPNPNPPDLAERPTDVIPMSGLVRLVSETDA